MRECIYDHYYYTFLVNVCDNNSTYVFRHATTTNRCNSSMKRFCSDMDADDDGDRVSKSKKVLASSFFPSSGKENGKQVGSCTYSSLLKRVKPMKSVKVTGNNDNSDREKSDGDHDHSILFC